jgi:hypothetical protein
LSPSTRKSLAAALLLYLAWVAATWLLEGRIDTLLRPAAVADRLVYALVANLLIGILGGLGVLRLVLHWQGTERHAAGFGTPAATLLAVLAGFGCGLAFYALSDPASRDPVIVVNAFAQVLVVSVAEVIVCWCVVGSVCEAAWRDLGRRLAAALAALVASVLFGVYHFAHSAPFNTLEMVAFLSAVGLLTSLFFFVSRNLYGTLVFHNFLAVLGVVKALAAGDLLLPMQQLQWPLLATAAVVMLVLAGADRLLVRSKANGKL